MSYLLEICCFTIDSCLIAERNGASRIELCSNPQEGGTTPSNGMINAAKNLVNIPVFPIIRPRGGDFLFGQGDFHAMKEDIRFCKKTGCDGVVVGLLLPDGRVDTKRLKILTDLAFPMEVTFHRAFDRAKDPLEALEDIIAAGCQRILTSGQKPTVDDGLPLLKQLVDAAGHRIIIMPGSGLRSSNIQQISEGTGATEFHTSARKLISSAMAFENKEMKEELFSVEVDGAEVAAIAQFLKSQPYNGNE